jgi:hypothetical protein
MMHRPTAIAPMLSALDPLIQKFWPPAAIACGLALTATWILLLGYGLFVFIEHAI